MSFSLTKNLFLFKQKLLTALRLLIPKNFENNPYAKTNPHKMLKFCNLSEPRTLIPVKIYYLKLLRVLSNIYNGYFCENTLRKKCSYSELFWSVFSCIRTEYGKIRSVSPYSVWMREKWTRITPNTDTFHSVIVNH